MKQILINLKNLFQETDQNIPFEKAIDSINNFNKEFLLEKEFLKDFFESVGSWILKNFSSPKLNLMLNLIILLLNKIKYKIEISKESN